MQFHGSLTRVFGIDTRALAAFRIGVGSLLIIDLGMRLRDLEAHYSDRGVLPLDVINQQIADSWRWSIHSLGGSAAFQFVLFAVAAVVALAYLVGYRTRLAAIFSWILLASLHGRNPFVVNGGDVLLRLLLFWSMFLPLDQHWSIRNARRGSQTPRVELSLASAAMLLQIGILYWMAGYFKLRGTWLETDTLERILQSDSYVKPIAYTLAEYPRLLSIMGSATLVGELLLPVLIFSPIWTRQIRVVAIVFFAFFHLGIELTLTVGLFSYISWVAWILFIPEDIWCRFARHASPSLGDQDPLLKESVARWRQRLVNLIICIAFVIVVWVNLATLREPWAKVFRSRLLTKVSDAVVLRQRWNLFPRPLQRDGWFIAVARLADGRTVDLFRNGLPADWESYSKPKYVSEQFPNHRWRKYYRRLVIPTRTNLRDPLSWYLIRNWNESHEAGEQIESFELHYMEEIGDDAEQEDRYQQRFFSELQVNPVTDSRKDG